MKTYVRIRSSYFEHDASKYRLSITQNTLIPSLQAQNSKDFTILLDMSDMDPFYTKRRETFASVGVTIRKTYSRIVTPRIEIEVGDDDFLCGNFVQVIQRVEKQAANTRLIAPNGYIFVNGGLHPWTAHPDMVPVTQFVEPDNLHVDNRIELSKSPAWIYVRHNCCTDKFVGRTISIPAISGLNWPGWKEKIVGRLSEMAILTGTAEGCQLHPTRSKSVVFARGSSRNRRK